MNEVRLTLLLGWFDRTPLGFTSARTDKCESLMNGMIIISLSNTLLYMIRASSATLSMDPLIILDKKETGNVVIVLSGMWQLNLITKLEIRKDNISEWDELSF